jgi:hypothetical protein
MKIFDSAQQEIRALGDGTAPPNDQFTSAVAPLLCAWRRSKQGYSGPNRSQPLPGVSIPVAAVNVALPPMIQSDSVVPVKLLVNNKSARADVMTHARLETTTKNKRRHFPYDLRPATSARCWDGLVLK